MLFSVLIANYNNGKYITDAIESVIGQTYKNWEIIVVDDCSTDNSINIIGEYMGKGHNISLYQNEKNMGCGYTKNKCVQLSNGEICAFVDPDDKIEENALELMIKHHKNNLGVSIIYSTLYYCDNKLNIKKKATWVKQVHKSCLHDNCISQFATFKKSFYLQTDGIDSLLKSAVDKDLYYKLEEKGQTLFLDKPLYYARESKIGISQFDNFVSAQENHLLVIQNAIKRRDESKYKNLSTIEYRKVKARMYYQRAEYYFKQSKRMLSIKCSFLSIMLYPNKFISKLKLIIRTILQ